MATTSGLEGQEPVRRGQFTYGGLTRAFRVSVPTTFQSSDHRSLVVLLHGCTQDADDVARGTRIDVRAAEMGVAVLMPEQPATAHPQRCWNWYDPKHMQRDSGEAALIGELARVTADSLGVDPRRVSIVGLSAGAAMAVNVAALFPDRFAAVATHSGVPALAAENVGEALAVMRAGRDDVAGLVARARAAMGAHARPVPILIIHGAKDAVVSVLASHALAAQWEALNRSLGAPASWVTLRIIPDLGHAWSGGDAAGSYTDPATPEVTTEVLRFLIAHPMPSGR
ncbi:MAG: PHB depolymerase family esterase [Gemmatimonadaceae bacterium]